MSEGRKRGRPTNAEREARMQASEAGRVLRAQRDVEPESESIERLEPRNEPASEPVIPRHEDNPRNKIYKELVESRKAALEEPEPEAPKEEPEVTETPEPVAVAPAPSPAAPPSVEPVAAAPVKVKVDGQEFEVPQEDIDEYGSVRAYQIAKAAENRLNKANEAVAESKRSQAQLMQLMQTMFARQQEPQKTPQQAIIEKIDQLRYGTPEESAKAMQEILELSNPRIDQAQIETRTIARMQQTLAVQKFKEQFPDVVGNPILFTAAKALEQERLQQFAQAGQMPDYNDFYARLGNELRAVIGPKPNQPPQSAAAGATTGETIPQTGVQTSTPTSVKEARKSSNIVSLPQASARATKPEEKEVSPEEARANALRQMRKARGQPTD